MPVGSENSRCCKPNGSVSPMMSISGLASRQLGVLCRMPARLSISTRSELIGVSSVIHIGSYWLAQSAVGPVEKLFASAPDQESRHMDASRGTTLKPRRVVPVLPEGIVACLFDLDGVLTRTANLHAMAWKEMFDAFLRERSEQTGESFRPF